jgi:tetratricopeptide (TPR) repeat protein
MKMPKKKRDNPSNQPADAGQPKSGDRRASERVLADIAKLLSQKEFGSLDEMNQFLQQMLLSTGGHIPEMPPQSPVEEAQNVMYKAWDSPNRAQRVKLARKALNISPDCADAYVLLAEEHAETVAEQRALYAQGVEAGERALKEQFKELKGHFWGHTETRPYMRARLGLAQCLWLLGELQAAADHMAAMLELNPNDNQGVRDLYITLLLELDDRVRIEKLLKQYRDDWSVPMLYGAALHEFRKNGRSTQAKKRLLKALDYNPHVPALLLRQKPLPKRIAEHYTPGDENEAILYVLDAVGVWSMIDGALSWLREVAEGTP